LASVPGPPSAALRLSLKRLDWRIVGAVAAAVIAIPVWRATNGHAKPAASGPAATPVAVCKVMREDLVDEVQYDAELRPHQEVDLHSKVAGYLQDIRVDIGDRVEKGQLMATIEVPELADDITRANAALNRNQQDVARAKAAYDEAHLVYTRLSDVNKAQPNLIAQQELDAALEKDQTTSSSLAAATAEVEVARADDGATVTWPVAADGVGRFAAAGASIRRGVPPTSGRISARSRPMICGQKRSSACAYSRHGSGGASAVPIALAATRCASDRWSRANSSVANASDADGAPGIVAAAPR
jgi:multidrug efflux pump subunit AcrA (membrane-fusion protein)